LLSLVLEGVYLTGHPWFIRLSHTEADIDEALERASVALKKAMA
jgi:hypothetical protein